MPRITAAWLSGAVMLLATGCSHFLETRAIEQFTAALAKEDLETLKATSSERFEQKALRREDGLDDFRILKLPTGEISIASVEDVDETRKKVTVEVGESKTKLQYDLVLNETTRKWVVDDIQVRQRKEGLKVTRSVTEQMDLLLSVRDFMSAWKDGERDDALDVTTPELRTILADLPAMQFARLTQRVVGDNKSSKLRPEAQLDGDVAVVRLPRSVGQLVLSLKLLDGTWKIDDLAVESRAEKDHIPSLKKMAIAMRTAAQFLTAYEAEDRKRLEQVCTPRFYASSLAPANFDMVNLPGADAPNDAASIKLQDRRADFIIPTEKELVKISLVRKDETEQSSEAVVEFLVEDVTLYELDGSQEKRISSLFTSHAILKLFCEALATGDLTMLRKTSTADFSRRVWNRIGDPATPTAGEPLRPTLQDLPVAQLLAGEPQIAGTAFQGALTEITVLHGSHRVVYHLRDTAGEVRVDDVQWKVEGLPVSFKERCEWLYPVRTLAVALQSAEIPNLQRACSFEFNRLVWNQAEFVPPMGVTAAHHLQAPLSSIESTSERAMITLGDEKFGAQVLLVREQSHFIVDEVLLIAGAEPQQRGRLKQELRNYFAEHGTRAPGAVMPASYEMPASPQPRSPVELPAPQPPSRTAERPAPVEDPTGLNLLEPSDSAFTPPAEEPAQAYSRTVK